MCRGYFVFKFRHVAESEIQFQCVQFGRTYCLKCFWFSSEMELCFGNNTDIIIQLQHYEFIMFFTYDGMMKDFWCLIQAFSDATLTSIHYKISCIYPLYITNTWDVQFVRILSYIYIWLYVIDKNKTQHVVVVEDVDSRGLLGHWPGSRAPRQNMDRAAQGRSLGPATQLGELG